MGTRRGPLDRLVDLALAVPTCTLAAAGRAVPLAARVGTLGAARLIGRVSEAVHERRSDTPSPVIETGVSQAVPSTRSAGAPVDSVSSDDLPIEGYDDLAARQVVDRLGALDSADLGRIESYERAHRNRSTVLGKISMLSA